MRLHLKLLMLLSIVCLAACKKTDQQDSASNPTGTVSLNGKEYKTIIIGNQTWLAESYAGAGGVAYGPNLKPQYGKYYTYIEAKAITLPYGWHLPTMDDYKNLGQANGVSFTLGASNTEALKKLISATGWINAKGTNASGFNAFPANMIYQGQQSPDGDVAEFWTAGGQTFSIMEAGANGASLNVQFFSNSDQPEYRFPIRFVKN